MPSATTSAPVRERELDDRSEHGARLHVGDAALHQREIDLDDVEADLRKQAQAGVAGADIVDGESDAGSTAGFDPAAHAGDVVHLLALGELDHEALRREVVALEDGDDRAAAELRRLGGGRREVDAEELLLGQIGGARDDRLDARQVERHEPATGLGRREERRRIGERGRRDGADEALDTHDLPGRQRHDGLVGGPQLAAGDHIGHG